MTREERYRRTFSEHAHKLIEPAFAKHDDLGGREVIRAMIMQAFEEACLWGMSFDEALAAAQNSFHDATISLGEHSDAVALFRHRARRRG